MTVRAGADAKDRQSQPDARHFERFCRKIVPGLLTDVCHVADLEGLTNALAAGDGEASGASSP
jgi:hypothetical protein